MKQDGTDDHNRDGPPWPEMISANEWTGGGKAN